MNKMARISHCGSYRYLLGRFWGGEHALTFVMLNPSTADADIDDPTIRRCIGFAKRENAGGVIVVNLFAYRATNPSALESAADPEGPENRAEVEGLTRGCKLRGSPIVCAWGAHKHVVNAVGMIGMLRASGARMVCLGKTMTGAPRHPLYVKGDQPFEAFP